MISYLNALLIAGLCQAAPMKETHEMTYVKRNGVEIPFYYPETTSKTFTVGESLTEQTSEQAVQFGTDYLLKELGLTKDDLEIQQSYRDDAGVDH
ncbi:hypothetical protein HDV01_003803, partial [Terramyces sp. JEL0728]